jgi:hypothetical protein
MPFTASAVMRTGDFLPGIAAVAALVLGPGRFERQLDEPGAEALDLFLHRRPDVVGLDFGAETAGGGDRLEAGDAGPDHERVRRLDRAGGGHHHRAHARHGVRGEQHGLVAGHRGHRRQHVHALGAGDAGNQFQGEAGDALRGEVVGGLWGAERVSHPDDDLAGPEGLGVLAPADRVGSRRPDLQQAIGLGEDVRPRGAHRGPLRNVLIIGEAGGRARAGLDDHRDTGLLERGDARRDDGDAPLAREGFLQDADCHCRTF